MAQKDYYLMKEESIVMQAKIHWTSIIPHIILMFVAIGFITIIIALLRMITTKLLITNKRVIGALGIIKSHSMDAPLNKINNIQVEQGLFGRMFDYGKVIITTSSGDYAFKQIVSPHHIKNALLEQMDIDYMKHAN